MAKNHKSKNEIYPIYEESQELQAQPQYVQARKNSKKKNSARQEKIYKNMVPRLGSSF